MDEGRGAGVLGLDTLRRGFGARGGAPLWQGFEVRRRIGEFHLQLAYRTCSNLSNHRLKRFFLLFFSLVIRYAVMLDF